MACWEQAKGQANRARIESALRLAGDLGLDRQSLAAATGLSIAMVKWYVQRMPDAVVRANPTRTDMMRMFHVDYRDACDAYTKAHSNPRRLHGYLSEEARNVCMAVIKHAGQRGATFEELAAASGVKTATIRQGAHYLIAMGCTKAKTKGCFISLFAPGIEPPKPEPKIAQVIRRTEPKRAPTTEKKPKKPVKLKKQSLVWNSTGLKAKPKKAPQIVMPRDVDYSRAKITQCPSSHDMRHTVHKPEPFFSALAIGSYLPADTWTARVYGGGR